MSTRPPAVEYLGGQRHDGPLYRSIVAIDIEGSTGRTNLVLRRTESLGALQRLQLQD